MEHVLKHRAEIYGLLALWIIVFHIDHDLINFPQIPILTNFIKIGNAGVDHFFFLSGYCIYLSLNRDSNVGNFLRKRFKRVVLVYLVIAIPFFIYKVVFETRTNVVANFFYDLSGLSFWFDKCRNVWFVHAIIVFYILTIPLYHLIKKNIGCGFFILFLIYALNYIGHFHSFYENAFFAYTRFPAYVFGMVLADAYHRYPIQKLIQGLKPSIKVFFSILLTGYFLFFLAYVVNLTLPAYVKYLLYITIIFPVLLLSLLFIKLLSKMKVPETLLATIGKLSLEVYLIHVIIVHICYSQKLETYLGYWAYLLVPLLAIPLSIAFHFFYEKNINKKQSN